MFSFSEYVTAWSAYLVCVIGILAVFWRFTRFLPWLHLKQPLRLIVAAFLLLPAQVEDSTLYWAPAWVKAILVLIFSGEEGVWPIAKLLLMTILLTLIVYFCLSIVMMIVRPQSGKSKKKRKKVAPA